MSLLHDQHQLQVILGPQTQLHDQLKFFGPMAFHFGHGLGFGALESLAVGAGHALETFLRCLLSVKFLLVGPPFLVCTKIFWPQGLPFWPWSWVWGPRITCSWCWLCNRDISEMPPISQISPCRSPVFGQH